MGSEAEYMANDISDFQLKEGFIPHLVNLGFEVKEPAAEYCKKEKRKT